MRAMANRRGRGDADVQRRAGGAPARGARHREQVRSAAPTTLPTVDTASPAAAWARSSTSPGRATASPTASSTSCASPGSGLGHPQLLDDLARLGGHVEDDLADVDRR